MVLHFLFRCGFPNLPPRLFEPNERNLGEKEITVKNYELLLIKYFGVGIPDQRVKTNTLSYHKSSP